MTKEDINAVSQMAQERKAAKAADVDEHSQMLAFIGKALFHKAGA